VEGSPFSKYLLPTNAVEGDKLHFPAKRPIITIDGVNDIKFALVLELCKEMNLAEATRKVDELNITLESVLSYVSSSAVLQGEGLVLKIKHGLVAHTSPAFKGMSGSFGTTDILRSSFSCIGISAGLGVCSPGSNYNVAVDVNRDDFKENYLHIVVPHLPINDQRHVANCL